MQHVTHSLKSADKICEYKLDLASIVEDTDWTQFGLQTDEWMDRQMGRQTDGQSETSISPLIRCQGV